MSKIRVAYIGDSPFIYSGFGVVSKAILSRLPQDEFEIHVLGTMYQNYPKKKEGEWFPDNYQSVCIHDLMGFKTSIDFVQSSNPDVLFFIGDPGTLRNRFSAMMMTGRLGLIPAVTYFPLEGSPFSPHVVEQARMVHSPVTYTKWGADELARFGVTADWVYHGSDHAPWERYDEAKRQRIRELVGWGDRFVVGLVGMNKRPNRQPAMLQAAAILKEWGHDDVMIYLHCQEQGEMFMGGWELDWQLDAYDVRDMVTLKPRQEEHKYIARPRTGTTTEVLDRALPNDSKEGMDNLADLDFTGMMNMQHLYIDPASSHGFNLPAVEAIMCGTPVATVDDDFARTEIFGDVAYMMKPTAMDHWHTGSVLPLVSPKRIAETIVMFKESVELRRSVAERCYGKFSQLKWQTAADLFAEKLKGAYEFGIAAVAGYGDAASNS